jgi:catalase (peroxidase I)
MSALESQTQRYWANALELNGRIAHEPFSQPAGTLTDMAANNPFESLKARATNLRKLRGYSHDFAPAPSGGDAA